MDPNGGINPSAPRLDSMPAQPAPAAPAQPMQPAQPSVRPVATPFAPASLITPPSIDGVPSVSQPAMTQPVIPADPTPTGIADSLIDQPIATASAESSVSPIKKILLIVVAILLLVGATGGAYMYGLSTGKTQGQNAAAAEYQKKLAAQQEEDIPDTTTDTEAATPNDTKLDLTDLKDPKYIDESIDGVIGKQVVASDGLALKVTNIERNYKTTDTNYKLDASKELIKINFLIGNQAKDKPKDINSFNFRLENSSGAQLTPESIASYPDKFDTVKLEVGAQSKGSIIYAVNKSEKPLKFIRSQTYRISGQNKEVTTKLVILVAPA